MPLLARWLGPLGEVMGRAPIPVLAAFAMTGALYATVHLDLTDRQETLLLSVTIAAFMASVAGEAAVGSLAALVAAALGAAGAYWADILLVNPVLWCCALVIAALVAPLVGGDQSAEAAWRRLVRQLAAAALALLGAGIVAGGVFVAEVSVEALFRVDVSNLTQRYVLPAAFGLLAPLVFLALGAERRQAADDRISEALGMVAQTFARLVLLPLLVIYAVVLAAYVARIAILQALPSGEVGWIVPLFVATGSATYFALASQPEPGWISRAFLRVWFWVTLPAIALYAVALGIRIDAYGFTPQRYLAVLAGVYFLATGLGFVVGGRRSDVRLLPVTGALLLLLGAIGPWSLVPVVIRSQSDQVSGIFAGEPVAATIRRMTPRERREVCSHVRLLDNLSALASVEAALKVREPGLTALCFEPYGSADPTIKVDFESGADVLTLEDGRRIWGPLSLVPDMDTIAARSEAMSLALFGTSLVVSVDRDRHTFDLAAAARAHRADPVPGDIILRSGQVSIRIRELHMLLPPDTAVLRFATVLVLAEPRPAPQSETAQ